MKSRNQHDSPRAANARLRESRSARLDLPVRHPPRWRFVLDQLLGSAARVHHYRQLSARMIGDTLNELDGRYCR